MHRPKGVLNLECVVFWCGMCTWLQPFHQQCHVKLVSIWLSTAGIPISTRRSLWAFIVTQQLRFPHHFHAKPSCGLLENSQQRTLAGQRDIVVTFPHAYSISACLPEVASLEALVIFYSPNFQCAQQIHLVYCVMSIKIKPFTVHVWFRWVDCEASTLGMAFPESLISALSRSFEFVG